MLDFQSVILELQAFWRNAGCTLIQPIDLEVGAGTFHPATSLRSLGRKPWRAAYTQACRRPTDGRYGENPNRCQHYYQFQVVLKPSPDEIQELYIASLEKLGLDFTVHDLRFVEDNWESPTLGAWGIGWEVWLNGMEISQFTFFQQMGGIKCSVVSGEITYGLERIVMLLQNKDNVFDVIWDQNNQLTYGDLFKENEKQMSIYNFQLADVEYLTKSFVNLEKNCLNLLEKQLFIPALEHVLKASHSFNLLDARGVISVSERQNYILKIRALTNAVATAYLTASDNV